MRRKYWYLSLYFSAILVLSFLLILSLGGGICLADNWARTADGGFDSSANYEASSMGHLGGDLYAGTRNDSGAQLWKNTGGGWTKAGDGGFGNTKNVGVSSMMEYNSKLYLGTKNTEEGGVVYSYNGTTFVPTCNPGFSATDIYPWTYDISSMSVYDNQLFAGTADLEWLWNIYDGCRIYMYNGSKWILDERQGFGDDDNRVATSMCVYDNYLYVGTRNQVDGCEIWRRDTGGNWEQVDTNPADPTIEGFGNKLNHTASTMLVHDGKLYVGVNGDKARIFKYDGSAWSPVGQDSLGQNGEIGVTSLVEFAGVLYAATDTGPTSSGSNVYRSQDHGATWTKATTDGFGNANNTGTMSLAVQGSKIFAGTFNDNDGCEVWSSAGPPGSIQSVTPGKGNHGQTLNVTIVGNGTHFQNGVSKAKFSGNGIKVNYTTVSGQTAVANITIAEDASTGGRSVNVVTNEDVPKGMQGAFEVLNPRITGVSPSSAIRSNTLEVEITGTDTDFLNWDFKALFSGSDIKVLSTSAINATHAKAEITLGRYAGLGTSDVGVKVNTDGIVVNPLKGGFTVKPHPPRLDGISPSVGSRGDTVTLTGDWFGSDRVSSNVTFNGHPVTTAYWSNNKIKCRVPSGKGNADVVVNTYAGSSNAEPFYMVNTMPGTNVSVNLGGGTSVVFDKVTSPGNTMGAPVQDPIVYPNSPLNGATLDITTSAGYSGNVRVTMSYARFNLPDYLEKTVAMFHQEGSGWRDVTVSRDTNEKTVTGQASGLSQFTLQVGAAAAPAASTWYLPEGSTAHGFDCYVTIENPNASDVTAQITYMMVGGPPVDGGVVTLPKRSQTTVFPRDKVGDADFSTQVTCKEEKVIAVDRTMTWSTLNWTNPDVLPPSEYHNSIGVTNPDTTWYLPEGSSKWGFECWLLIQNPNATEATCTVTYMIEDGKPVTLEKKVPANSRETYNMDTDIGAADASIRVESDIPVIPERSMYRNNRREGHDSIGTTTAAEDYFLAEGTSAWGFTTYVTVQNPNDEPADVTVTYMTQDGPQEQPSFQMPANSRETIRVNDTLPGKDFSTKVHGSLPIIAERPMYWNNGTGEAATDSIGESDSHKMFYLPDGSTVIDWETYTTVQNPNDTDVEVEVSYLTASGSGNVAFTRTIPAGTRRTFSMGDKLMNQRAAIMVVCKTAGKTINVERAMYYNKKGAGTATIGGYSD